MRPRNKKGDTTMKKNITFGEIKDFLKKHEELFNI